MFQTPTAFMVLIMPLLMLPATVGPFFERLLLAFPHLQYKLPVKGETRVAGYLLTAVFLYQVAVILNVVTKKPPLEVTHLIQFL